MGTSGPPIEIIKRPALLNMELSAATQVSGSLYYVEV